MRVASDDALDLELCDGGAGHLDGVGQVLGQRVRAVVWSAATVPVHCHLAVALMVRHLRGVRAVDLTQHKEENKCTNTRRSQQGQMTQKTTAAAWVQEAATKTAD